MPAAMKSINESNLSAGAGATGASTGAGHTVLEPKPVMVLPNSPPHQRLCGGSLVLLHSLLLEGTNQHYAADEVLFCISTRLVSTTPVRICRGKPLFSILEFQHGV